MPLPKVGNSGFNVVCVCVGFSAVGWFSENAHVALSVHMPSDSGSRHLSAVWLTLSHLASFDDEESQLTTT